VWTAGEDSTMDKVERLQKMAMRMRLQSLEMALIADKGGAHLGGGLSAIEIFAVLYGEILRLDSQNPLWEDRDIFLTSKGHCILAQLPALFEKSYITKEELLSYANDGNKLKGSPYKPSLGLEYSAGSLGLALGVGIGLALAAREDKKSSHVYVLLGDGELNEGSNWEAFMAGAHYKLSNLTAIIDRNHLCYDGDTEDIMAIEDLSAKFKSFNWHTISCDGHNISALLNAFEHKACDKPNVIIAHTIKGKGVSFMENKREWHHGLLSKSQYEQAVLDIKNMENI